MESVPPPWGKVDKILLGSVNLRAYLQSGFKSSSSKPVISIIGCLCFPFSNLGKSLGAITQPRETRKVCDGVTIQTER